MKNPKSCKSSKKKQEEEDPDILPKVTLNDVPKRSKDFPLIQEKCGNIDVFHHACFTNNIVYSDLIFNLPLISEEDLSYLRLFTTLFSQIGCADRDYKANLEYMQSHTGGVGASLALNIQALQENQFLPTLHIKGKALYRKVNKLFPFMEEMATQLDFTDIPRIKEILLKHYTALQSSINQSALRYAISLSASSLNVASRVANSWYGLDYFWLVKNLTENFETEAKKLVEKLQHLQSKLSPLDGAHLLVTCDSAMYNDLKKHEFYGLQHLQTKPYKPWQSNFPLKTIKTQGRVISAPVAFTGKVFNTVSYTHPDSPALNIAAHIFDNLTLHTRIREQGGAYGAGASNNALAGNFYFYAYRDPNISKTLSAFEEAIQEVAIGNFDENDLDEAKLEMIQALDSPVAPGSRGEIAYSWFREGRTVALRQAFRDKVLALTCQDVVEAVQRQIIPNYKKAVTVVFAGKELLEKENNILKSQHQPELEIAFV